MSELTDAEVSTVRFYRWLHYTDLEIATELLENRHGPEGHRLRMAVMEV